MDSTFTNTQGQDVNYPSPDSETDEIINKDIFELMGVSEMPPEQKQQLFRQMEETVQKRAMAKIDDQLPEPDKAQFKQLIDTGTPDQLLEFLKARNIDLNQALTHETLAYKAEMAKLANPLKRTNQQ